MGSYDTLNILCISVQNLTRTKHLHLQFLPRNTWFTSRLRFGLKRQTFISILHAIDKMKNRFTSTEWNLSTVLKQSLYCNTCGTPLYILWCCCFILCNSSLCIPAGDWIVNGLQRSILRPHLVLYFQHHLTPVGILSRQTHHSTLAPLVIRCCYHSHLQT